MIKSVIISIGKKGYMMTFAFTCSERKHTHRFKNNYVDAVVYHPPFHFRYPNYLTVWEEDK